MRVAMGVSLSIRLDDNAGYDEVQDHPLGQPVPASGKLVCGMPARPADATRPDIPVA